MKQNAIINRAVLTGSATLLGMVSGAFAGDPAPYVPAPTPEPLCGSPGWTLEAAVLYMKPHQSEGEIADSDWDAGYRFGLAYEMPDGLRFALRVFGFDGTGEYGEGRYGEGRYRNNDVEEEFFALDFLVGDTFCPSEDLSIAINVGLRYASYKEDWKYYSDGKAADFDGFGPVIGTEIVRQLGGNWALYAELQASIIFGDNDIDDFALFKRAYIEANGPGSFQALLAVPEPSSLVCSLAAVILVAIGLWKTTTNNCTIHRNHVLFASSRCRRSFCEYQSLTQHMKVAVGTGACCALLASVILP